MTLEVAHLECEPAVLRTIVETDEVDLDTARRWFVEMLRFLESARLAHLLPDQEVLHVAPTAPVDAAWHAFLLHAADYRAYCEHHLHLDFEHQRREGGETAFSRAEGTIVYAQTRRRLELRFGALDPEIWPRVKRSQAGAAQT